ncbi:Alpha amylase-like protein [Euroglyphus maynei]|uniref:Alpha amylase-like protein n=1 Tax=Euroglyphus maynei TaxID=6958 RepID=A0A1Y3BUM9_EURMA|nr:Alpha amylase-like protein [Euroglyphus maynei]
MANSPDHSPVDDSIDPDKEARMLLNPPTDSVQFTPTSTVPRDPTNGQVLLSPSGSNGGVPNSAIRSGVGMTKQELMKYANDPFWVRLRTFLFILFWVIWFAMLIGSVIIVAMAPGCPATASLPWWKKASIMELYLGETPPTNRSIYVGQFSAKLDKVESRLEELAEKNVDTIIIGPFDPYVLMDEPNDSNSTLDSISKLRSRITSLAKNDKEIKVIVSLRLQQTPESFHWYNWSKSNLSEYEDAYLWSSEKPKTPLYKYDVDRLQYVALGSNNSPLLNYGSAKVRDLIHETILAWMKTKVEGIQNGAVWIQDPSTGEMTKSKEAELDMKRAVKTAGQNKVFLITDQQLAESAFEDGEEEASFDMAPDANFWKDLQKEFKPDPEKGLKELFERRFAPYVEHEQKTMSNENKTEADNLITRENVGKHWRTYQIPHPADPSNRINREWGLSMAEAATIATFMMPHVTPALQFDLAATPDIQSVLNKSNIPERMLKLRRECPETFLAGRTILPKVQGSSSVFALYRGAKNDNGYLLLVNQQTKPQSISIDSNELPYQDVVISRRVIMVNSDSNSKDSIIGIDINLGQIKMDAKQTLLVEFSVN